MNENLNLAEILKDCPRGTKLYSTQYGEVEFEKVRENSKYPITIRLNDSQIDMFASDGRWNKSYNGECVLFPSKDQRDWSKFNHKKEKEELVPPYEFKDGDILSYQCGGFKNRTIYIYKYHKIMNTSYYVALGGDSDSTFRVSNKEGCALNGYNSTVRFATEEEKQKLFDAIKINGYKWNAETKTLEKLVAKFKVGDWIVTPKNEVLQITSIEDSTYRFNNVSHYWRICYCDEQCRLWTIQDAKDGDVLAAHDCYVIFKEIDGLNIKCYCTFHYLGLNPSFYRDTLQNKNAFLPATKEQRYAMMKAMNDAGYEWDEEKKELKLVEPKFKYTQEVLEKYINSMSNKDDERLRKTAIAFLKDFAEQGYENAVECIDWLEKQGE